MNNRENSFVVPDRMAPARPLPPYSYVSGKFPHPTRDPRGHSFDVVEANVSIHDATEWRDCEAYVWGIDLFNHGFYWEAHESWEAVWLAAGRRGAIADFCKALIKLAAAGVKAREGRPDGVKRHATRACQLLKSVAKQAAEGEDRFMGLTLSTVTRYAEDLVRDPDLVTHTSDEPVVVVMPFTLSATRD